MGYSGGVIYSPVSMADVQHVLGISSKALDKLCKAVVIKKWARRKPVSYAKIPPLTDAEFTSIHCGITHTSIPLIDNSGRVQYDNSGWRHTKPSGGENSPYRLSDFNGYNHGAVCPLKIVFPSGDLPIPSSQDRSTTLGFAITFEQGISGWSSDGTMMFMRDVFYSTSELNMYPTLALVHYLTSTSVMYAISAASQLYNYVASATDSSHLSPQPVVNILLDMYDFKSKVENGGGSSYLAANTKWQCVVFLSSNKVTGIYGTSSNVVSQLGTTELMQLNNVAGEGDEYQHGFDRVSRKIVIDSWVDSITKLRLTTILTRSGATTYNITSAEIEITRTAGQGAITFNVGFNAIIVGGVMSTGGSFDEFNGVTFETISLAANETYKSKTYSSSAFTGHSYVFNAFTSGNVYRAVLNAIISNSGSQKSIGTEIDTHEGLSRYEVSNPAT